MDSGKDDGFGWGNQQERRPTRIIGSNGKPAYSSGQLSPNSCPPAMEYAAVFLPPRVCDCRFNHSYASIRFYQGVRRKDRRLNLFTISGGTSQSNAMGVAVTDAMAQTKH